MDNKDFEDQVEKIPYQELLNDPDFKKQLRKEYESVKAIDIQLSRQKFIERHLTPDELKILNELDLTPKSGYYFQNEAEQKRDALAKEFDEMVQKILEKEFEQLEIIPEKYMTPDIGKTPTCEKEFDEMEQIPDIYKVRDIKQTPTYKALSNIQRLLCDYEDLAMQNVDTSKEADECFFNLKRNLKTLNNSAQLMLIDEIILSDINIAVWTHKKFHPDENVYEYQKRWEQLRNSLNTKFFEYKDKLVLAEKENDDIADFNDLAKDLADYVVIDGQTLRNIIRFKVLPSEQKDKKRQWIGLYADAAYFSDKIGLELSEWNKCFIHSTCKPLRASHRSYAQYKEKPIKNILSKYEKLFYRK